MKYCKKCGTQMDDGADFCPNCGTKASAPKNIDTNGDKPAQSEQKLQSPKPKPDFPGDNRQHSGGFPSSGANSQPSPQKKKKLPLPALIGIIAAVVAVIVIVIAVNSSGNLEKVQTHKYFENISNTTAGEIVNAYVDSPVWDEERAGNRDFVYANGRLKGTQTSVMMGFYIDSDGRMTEDFKIGDYRPGEEGSRELLRSMYEAYDAGEADLLIDELAGNSSDLGEPEVEEQSADNEPLEPTTNEDFTLTQQQATDLLTDVAAPLLLNEWNSVMTYPDIYNPQDWQNLPHVDISDFDNMTQGNIDTGNEYWVGFYTSLFYVNDRGINSGYNEDFIFGDATAHEEGSRVSIDKYAVQQYFKDAFGTDIPERLMPEYIGYSWDDMDAFTLELGDPYADIVISELPKSSVEVRDGKVTFTGNLTGMFVWDQSWDATGIDSIPWEITLDVVENPDSRFGCNVTGYQVSAAEGDAVQTAATTVSNPATLAAFDGWWYGDGLSFYINNGYVTYYNGFFYDEWGTEQGTLTDDGELSVWVGFKEWMENFVFEYLTDDKLEVTHVAQDNEVFEEPFIGILYRAEYIDTIISTSFRFHPDGFVFPDSSSRYLTESDLAYYNKEILGYARNEIFARHGNIFETPRYRDWYSQFSWYNNLPKKVDVGYADFNDYEIANVELIKQLEEAAQ